MPDLERTLGKAVLVVVVLGGGVGDGHGGGGGCVHSCFM